MNVSWKSGSKMLDLNPKLARGWSRMGPRAVYGQILYELAKTNPNLMALSADLGRSSGLDRFSKDFHYFAHALLKIIQ